MVHIKRYEIPGFWSLGRKTEKFATTPSPGPHAKQSSVPLMLILRDVLKYAETAKEAKKILNSGGVVIDKRVVKDRKHPAGLMDVIEIPQAGKSYRVMPGASGLKLVEIGKQESDRKLCRINGVTILRGGSFQLNLHDGRCVSVGKEKKYKPGDSVLISLPGQKILKHFQLKEGGHAFVIAGRNIGTEGRIKQIVDRKVMTEGNRAVLETKSGDIETLKEYMLVGELK